MKLDITRVYPFIPEKEINLLEAEATRARKTLYEGSGEGSEFLGWRDLPTSLTGPFLEPIRKAVGEIRDRCELVVVVGIGGSYLGSKAVYEALENDFPGMDGSRDTPRMLFAGHHMSQDYMHGLLQVLDARSYAIIVISKSGTTTEPALAFRFLRDHLERKEGREGASKRIIAVTDAGKGALRHLADEEGYQSFVIPDDVGGRFSVFTPVGLVPLAACGVDIRALAAGAADLMKKCDPEVPFGENPAALYAATRNALYRSGRPIEILVNYHHKLHYLAEWWKQLFGESEGKDGKGIFPAAVDNSTDLHSLGQYIQEGERILFETVVSIENPSTQLRIPEDTDNLDNLNYLSGHTMDHVNKMAELGTMLAHVDGGVPNIQISVPALDAYHLGQMMYFFENACGISGYMLGVNPFNQPGVEAYKKNMFALLQKPGFEELAVALRKKIQ